MPTYRVAPDALSATLADGAVLLNLETKRYYTLNETGTRIWALLERGHDRTEIVRTLVAEYEIDRDRACQATDTLLDELLGERLILPD
jgi:hypothetical protein